MATIRKFIAGILINLIRMYGYLISPFLGHRCRFTPSCSQYMITAITYYGVLKGLFLGIKRLCRCHPFCPGGCDPVKQKEGRHGY